MKETIKLQKWGNSIVLPIPKAFAEQMNLQPNSSVELVIDGDRLVVTPLTGRNTLIAELRQQIQGTHCVLVIAGMYAAHRYWIQKEIDIADKFSKPILGIIPRGHRRTPKEVQRAAIKMVAWNTSSIVSAIRTYSL